MEDLGQALASMEQLTPEEKKIEQIWDKYDVDKNGFLDK